MIRDSNNSQKLSLSVGPLNFDSSIPNPVLSLAHKQLEAEFANINPDTVTQLSLNYNKFSKHMQCLRYYKKWLKSYALKRVLTINCSFSPFIMLEELKIFQCTSLENLILSDCEISTIQPLTKANFPSLCTMVLYNNNITSISSLRKFHQPFLTELIIDNNLITNIDKLSQGRNDYLQKIEINNNQIISITELLKCRIDHLCQVRLQNYGYLLEKCSEDLTKKHLQIRI